MPRVTIGVVLTSLVQVAASAGSLTVEAEPTPGLPGYTSWTVGVATEPGEDLRGFDATFTGPMNQAYGSRDNPFTNFNLFLPAGGAQDSQFLFASGDVLSIGVEESDTRLKGAVSGLNRLQLPNPAPIARIVAPNDGAIEYQIWFDLGVPETLVYIGRLSNFNVPEPHTAGLVALLAATRLAQRRG